MLRFSIQVGILIVASLPMCVIAHNAELEKKLVAAASSSRVTDLAQLVKQGDVDLKSSCALMAAVMADRFSTVSIQKLAAVKYLVEQRAELNVSKCNGRPIDIAYEAARLRDRALMEYLVKHGVDVNSNSAKDASSFGTPLLQAVYYGELDAARLIIEFGADVNRVNVSGNTALHQALTFTGGSEKNKFEFVKLLLENGADPEAKDGNAITARQNAMSIASVEVSALIEKMKPAPANALNASAVELYQVTSMLILKDICDNGIPGFKDRADLAYTRWASKKAPLIAQMKDNSRYKESMAQNRLASEKPTPEDVRHSNAMEMLNVCEDTLDQFSAVDKSGPDPELATPEKTWARFVLALRAADRQAAIACLIFNARNQFRWRLKEATNEQLVAFADSIKSFSLTGVGFGNIVEAVLVRQNGHAGIIYFHKVSDEWKITEM